MNEETVVKTSLSGLGAVLAFFSDNFTTAIIWLLILFEAADYLTGIITGIMRKNLESRKAFWGFIKKLCYFVLIGVAFGVDYLLSESLHWFDVGFQMPHMFGSLAICYLLTTEAISILENLGEMGIDVPFLSRYIKKLRDRISEKGGDGE